MQQGLRPAPEREARLCPGPEVFLRGPEGLVSGAKGILRQLRVPCRQTPATTAAACAGESQSIGTSAFSRLRREALQAPRANLATVSGATYTSGAYRTSLQAETSAAHA